MCRQECDGDGDEQEITVVGMMVRRGPKLEQGDDWFCTKSQRNVIVKRCICISVITTEKHTLWGWLECQYRLEK